MRIALRAMLGAIIGLIAGAAAGVLAGIAWTSLAETSNFEGHSAMLVFFAFGPAGALLGAILGAIWLGRAAARARIRLDSQI